MLASLLFAGVFLQVSAANASPPAKPVAQGPPVSINVQAKPVASKTNDVTDPVELLKVKRIYVDSFGDDAISKEMQSMIVSSLVSSKRFKVTENRARADATLKGATLEKTSQEIHAYGESTAVGGASGAHSSSVNGSFVNGTGSVSGSSSGGFVARHLGTSDSSLNTETINEARVAVRLVNPDGDVIWTSTQESKGAKYKGSSADVAEKCVKQLLRDIEKLESSGTTPATPSTTAASEASKH
jgi:curli biogenesis system outer membrane secretion channel CsgG